MAMNKRTINRMKAGKTPGLPFYRPRVRNGLTPKRDKNLPATQFVKWNRLIGPQRNSGAANPR